MEQQTGAGATQGSARRIGVEHLPDDVLAEEDADERRLRAAPPFPDAAEPVPEDVLGERDLEARVGEEEAQRRRVEGRPPATEEPRS